MDRQSTLKSISEILKETIREDVYRGVDSSAAYYLDKAKREIMTQYGFSRNYGLIKRWTKDDAIKFCDEVSEELVEIINGYLHNYKTKRLAKEIKATSAQAVIKAAMQEAGLKHQFIAQTYRAKILYPICKNRCLSFYITYSKLNEQLPQVIQSLKMIEEGMNGLGKNPTINREYNINWI